MFGSFLTDISLLNFKFHLSNHLNIKFKNVVKILSGVLQFSVFLMSNVRMSLVVQESVENSNFLMILLAVLLCPMPVLFPMTKSDDECPRS